MPADYLPDVTTGRPLRVCGSPLDAPSALAIVAIVRRLMTHVSPEPGLVIAASIAARSAAIAAGVAPVLVTAGAPTVTAAGRTCATAVTVLVKNCASTYAATPRITVSRTVCSLSGLPTFSSSFDSTTIFPAL